MLQIRLRDRCWPVVAGLFFAASSVWAADRAVAGNNAGFRVEVGPAVPLQFMSADCAGEVRPDRVVIVGGMTVESLKPVEAQERLDRQLAELRKFVIAQNGSVNLLERVRAARAAGGHGGNRPEALPFLALQRLEIEFPAAVAIDALLERVLQFGLDRFGSSIRTDYVDGNRQVAVRYRFSALHTALDSIHRQCRIEAVNRWCAGEGAAAGVCALSAGERDALVRTHSLILQTQPLLTEHGGVTRLHLNYPWQAAQLASVEPLGDLTVRFQGALQLGIPARQP